MTYADTDFFLALLKPTNWLKENARRILEKEKGKIYTSEATYIELMLLAKRYGLDPVRITVDVMAICNEKNGEYQAAAELISQNVGVFDSFHAVHSNGKIISSDKIYRKLGIEQIDLSDEKPKK
ncbi:MAG: PIN domain-containing protein [Candidatus Thermoplasmatota archaeon]|nr:PIN domain-containing protein [Candidatus Thermoplasmatota archaeon]MCL5730492.1 PIN domain-containing protein [Candidatus Thermoplasmatota archaeon]